MALAPLAFTAPAPAFRIVLRDISVCEDPPLVASAVKAAPLKEERWLASIAALEMVPAVISVASSLTPNLALLTSLLCMKNATGVAPEGCIRTPPPELL